MGKSPGRQSLQTSKERGEVGARVETVRELTFIVTLDRPLLLWSSPLAIVNMLDISIHFNKAKDANGECVIL